MITQDFTFKQFLGPKFTITITANDDGTNAVPQCKDCEKNEGNANCMHRFWAVSKWSILRKFRQKNIILDKNKVHQIQNEWHNR